MPHPVDYPEENDSPATIPENGPRGPTAADYPNDFRTHGHGGRWLTYDPNYHIPLLLECMNQGMSVNETCRHMRISAMTLCTWSKRFPEFEEAVKMGKCFARGWWDRQARLNVANPTFNTGLYMAYRTNMHGWLHARSQTSVEMDAEFRDVKRLEVDLKTLPADALRLLKEAMSRVQGKIGDDAQPSRAIAATVEEKERKLRALPEA